MTEKTAVDILAEHYEKKGVVNFGVTTSYELGLSDKKPTAEEIAESILAVEKEMMNPIKNIIGLIKGEICFGLKETLMPHYDLSSDIFEEKEYTPEEKYERRRARKHLDILNEAIEILKTHPDYNREYRLEEYDYKRD